MPITLTALPPRAGIYLYELTAGPTPPVLALFRRTYIIGTATQGTEGAIVQIGSNDDFLNQFGSSSALTLDNVAAYLANTKLGLFYIRATAYPMTTVTVTNTDEGVKSVTINGTVISHTAASGATMQSIITALVTAINDSTAINTAVEAEFEIDGAGANVFSNSRFYIRSKTGATFTIAGSGTTFTAVAAPSELQYWDYLRVIAKVQDTLGDEPLGFLCAPEAFYNLESQYERTNVGNALEQAARDLNWMACLDPGNPSIVDTAAKAVADSTAYTALRGHSAYDFPYLENLDNDPVSPSVMSAAIAIRRYEAEGIHQPPGGPSYPLNGVSGPVLTLGKADLDLMATNRINPYILKRGVGTVRYDTYTRASDPNYRHISTRIIMSCLDQTLLETLEVSGLLFQATTPFFFTRIKAILNQVCQIFYDNDALFGTSAEEAFEVICDANIQDPAALEQGDVYAEVYACPTGTGRRIRVNVYRVQIGQMQLALNTVSA